MRQVKLSHLLEDFEENHGIKLKDIVARRVWDVFGQKINGLGKYWRLFDELRAACESNYEFEFVVQAQLEVAKAKKKNKYYHHLVFNDEFEENLLERLDFISNRWKNPVNRFNTALFVKFFTAESLVVKDFFARAFKNPIDDLDVLWLDSILEHFEHQDIRWVGVCANDYTEEERNNELFEERRLQGRSQLTARQEMKEALNEITRARIEAVRFHAEILYKDAGNFLVNADDIDSLPFEVLNHLKGNLTVTNSEFIINDTL